jgi:hypothetical protein
MVLSCVVYRYLLLVAEVVGLKVDSASNTCMFGLLYTSKNGHKN